MLKIALTNLGKYNEGELCFAWLELPCTFAEYVDALEEIGIDGVQYEEVFVSDYDTDIDGLAEHLSEYSDIELLNWLAGEINKLCSWEIKNFESLLEYGEHTDGILELLDLVEEAQRCDNAILLPDVDDDEALGRYWIDESGCYDLKSMGNLANYFDYESFGRDVRLEEGGVYTEHGYISIHSSSWMDYSKEDMPEEYRLRRGSVNYA